MQPGRPVGRVAALAASMAGAAAGLLAGIPVFFLATVRPWNHHVTVRQLLDPMGMTPLYAIAITALSLVGWLIFGLPLALRARRAQFNPVRPVRLVVIGTVVGALLVTIAYTLLFHGEQYAVRGSFPYELSAIVNAATATATCLWLLRRHTPIR